MAYGRCAGVEVWFFGGGDELASVGVNDTVEAGLLRRFVFTVLGERR